MATSPSLAQGGVTEEFEIGQSQFRDIIQGSTKDRNLQKSLTKALNRHAAPSRRAHFAEVLHRRLQRFNLDLPIGRAVDRV